MFRYYNAPLVSGVEYTVWFGVVVVAGDKTKTTYTQVSKIQTVPRNPFLFGYF